ncbi:MAG: NFACT family protein, partial [Candidatus Poseidoniales archaeon]|nr:NFACT family protein [Candidatus Poseidoniales archaeon]
SFDVARIVAELLPYIGSRARKSYHPHWEQVVLRLNPKEEAQIDLVVVRGKRIYLSRRDRPMPPNPSSFSMLMRKHLMNGRFVDVRQHGFDRIITLDFETGDGLRSLVIEMFRDGNVLLLDSEGVIIQPLTNVKYAKRILKRGENYEFPPAQVDPRTLTAKELAPLLAESDADIVRTLASRANLAGAYAEAICGIAEISVDRMAVDLDDGEIADLVSGLHSLTQKLDRSAGGLVILASAAKAPLQESGNNPLALDAVFEEHAREALPFLLPANENDFIIEFPNLAAAVDAWKGGWDATAMARRQQEKAAQMVDDRQQRDDGSSLERRLIQQERAIIGFEAKGDSQQQLGILIQDNWGHIDTLLTQTLSAIEADGWDNIRSKVRDIEWIESLDPAKRTMKAYLPDEDGEPDQRIELHLDDTVHQNAQRYFDAGRKQKDKTIGAKKAIEETRAKIASSEKKRAKEDAAGKLHATKRSKQLWIERHRWAVVGDGHLILGGKDAKGNDAVVNKYLKREDLYFHADLHGAPSCALKLKEGIEVDPHPLPGLPEGVPALRLTQTFEVEEFDEKTIQEAAALAVVWSRGWSGGGAAATAFWVEPPQVSKTAETGESLGRGAWIIRGKRNWLRDLTMEMTLGMAVVNGIPLPLVGAHDAVTKWCERWVRIGTGTIKKEAMANKIAKATGLVQDDVLAALPPGNIEIIEDNELLKS